MAELPVVEYTALQVKQAVVGHGKAAKEQVADMVRRLLDLPGAPSADAADALACAIAHAHSGQGSALAGGSRRARMTAPRSRVRAPRGARRRAARHWSRSARPAAVIFDMDGLMLDTEPLAARAWGDGRSDAGRRLRHVARAGMIGRNFADCSAMLRARYVTPYPVDALLGRWHAAYDAIVEREGLALKPGVDELLDWLEAPRFRAPWRPRRGTTARAASSPARRCCRASTRSSAATTSRVASRRPTSTSRPRGGSGRGPPTASRSRTRSPASGAPLPQG
jgi:hypothetical protein